MKAGWESTTVGNLSEVVTKGTTPTSVGHKFTETGINFIKVESLGEHGQFIANKLAHISEDCHETLRRSQIKEGDILFSIAGALGRTAVVPSDIVPANTNQALSIIRLKNDAPIHRPFLVYALSSGMLIEQIEKARGGVAQQNLSLAQVKAFNIPLPPLEEQQRIVAVLDEAFEGLARARAHAEANLQNARDLFESLRFAMLSERTEGWEAHRLGDCFRLKSGENLTAKDMVPGPFPVYGGNGIAGTHHESNLSGDNVIIGRVGALCGNARSIDHDIWLTDNAFKVVHYNFGFDHRFLTYLLNFKNLRSLARQAAQPVISNSSLADLELTFPASVELQAELARKLAAAETELEDIQMKYEAKIKDIEDLRQSLLQKAFAGELT